MMKLHPIVYNYFRHFYEYIFFCDNYGLLGATDLYEVSLTSFGSLVLWEGVQITQ